MKTKFWQTDEFKELETQWYLKLEQEKFKDIEITKDGRSLLKQRASNCYRQESFSRREAKQIYYEKIAQGTHEEKHFKDDIEQLIMERRSAGVKLILICKELEDLGERCHRCTIWRIIKKYERKWLIKK